MADTELATIKKPGEVEYISKEQYLERVKEIARCKRDIKYFAEKYFKIINLDKGLMTINLYPKQKELLDFFVKEKRCICCASRQSSKTTTYTIYLLWLTMFHPDKKVMLLANKLDTCIEICERLRLAYQYLPPFLKPAVVTWNKAEISFSNHSVIKGFATASDAARGFSANCVVADEFSFVPNNVASKVFESIYPVISSSKNSQFIIVSTPNGADPRNLYYEIWQKANGKNQEKNTDGWKAFRFDWWDVPGRDEQWKRNTIASIGERRFAQEFGNEFLASSSVKKLIPDDIIEKYRMIVSNNKNKGINQGKDLTISSKDGTKNYVFRMYDDFDSDHTYLASFDVAEGIKKDSSVLYIWDITETSNIRMVMKFSSNEVSPLEFAYISNELLKLYANPFLAGESNGIALGYIQQLRITYGYQHFVMLNKDHGCGIDSHVQSRTKAVMWFRDMMTTVGFGFDIPDAELIDEFSTFVRKETKVHEIFGAVGDNHDDHIMTMIWACWILNNVNIQQYFVVADTFTSSLGVVYPRNIQPLLEYENEELKYILNDSNIKAFQFYKQEQLDNPEYNKSQLEKDNNIAENFKMLKQQTIIRNEPQQKINFRDESRQVFSGDDYLKQKRNQEVMDNLMGMQPATPFIAGTGDSIVTVQNYRDSQPQSIIGSGRTQKYQIDDLFGWENEPMW